MTLTAALALLPFLPSLAYIVSHPWCETCVDDDVALLELSVRSALTGDLLVGPYSRFQWRHPGPALSYALAPVYALSGERTMGLYLGTLLFNMASAAASVLVAWRLAGRGAAFLAAVAFAVFASHLGPSLLANPWNPFATILPFTLALFLCWGLVEAGLSYLPGVAFLASVLVQTHVGYLPVLGVAGLLCLAMRLRRERVRPAGLVSGLRASGRAIGLAVAIFFVLWLPPLVEELRNSPGNLTRLARFFGSQGHAHTFAEVFEGVSRNIAALPLEMARLLVPSTSDERGHGAGTATLLLVALLVAAGVASAVGRVAEGRLTARTVPALLALSAAVFVAAFLSANQVVGPLLAYLLAWVSGVGVMAWFGVALFALAASGNLVARARRGGRARALAVGLGLSFVLLATRSNATRLPSQPPISATSLPVHTELAPKLMAYLKAHGASRPLVRIGFAGGWVPAAGLVLQLEKNAFAPAVEDDWVFMFGSERRSTGREGCAVALTDEPLAAELSKRPDHALLARAGELSLFVVTDPRYVDDHTLRERPTVIAVHETSREPSLVADGRIPPEGSPWNAPEALILKGPASFVALELPRVAGHDVAGLLVTADHNDDYRVLVSTDGLAFEDAGAVPLAPMVGLRSRAFFSPRLREARFVRITPRGGDGSYSIAEVRLLGGAGAR